jgi:hypothetical protein
MTAQPTLQFSFEALQLPYDLEAAPTQQLTAHMFECIFLLQVLQFLPIFPPRWSAKPL